MAKKTVVYDDTAEPRVFKFEKPKDTLRAYFIEINDDGLYVFEDEDGVTYLVEEFPQLVKALDTVVNGKKVRDTELLLEIEYMGTVKKNGQPYEAYRVSVE